MSHSQQWQHQRENGHWECQSADWYAPTHFSKFKNVWVGLTMGLLRRDQTWDPQDSQQPLARQHEPELKETQDTCTLLCSQVTNTIMVEFRLKWQAHTNTCVDKEHISHMWVPPHNNRHARIFHRPSALLVCICICICNLLWTTNLLNRIKASYLNMNLFSFFLQWWKFGVHTFGGLGLIYHVLSHAECLVWIESEPSPGFIANKNDHDAHISVISVEFLR